MKIRLGIWEGLFYAALLLIYGLSRNPYPEFGDSLGFVYHASIGFDWATNATSHFLYANLNHVLVVLLPFLSPVLVLSLVSLLFGILSVEQLRQLGLSLKLEPAAALFAAAIFALGFSWWRQVVTIEVYSMQLFWVLRMLVLMSRDEEEGIYRRGWWVSLLYGLSLLAHIQNLLLLPLWLYYYWRGRTRHVSMVSAVLAILLFGVLFISASLRGTNTYAAIFFDRQFQGEVMQFEMLTILKGFARSLGYLAYNFHVFLVPIAWGLWLWLRERKAWILALIGASLLFWGFAMRYNVNDNYVFFLMPYGVLAIAGGLGYQKIAQGRKWEQWGFALSSLSILVYLLALFAATQVPELNRWAEPKAYKGGLKYYLYPGRASAPDPVKLAQQIQNGEIPAIPDFDRYEMALKVGEVSHKKY
ncbi:MAG: DUF2723 domain-containing protein [Bacteroidota bacterium]